ncbi:MAG: OB-fold nucleic acid binding domain-containing protein, partial [Candidatus Ranarchaeia archaeon]
MTTDQIPENIYRTHYLGEISTELCGQQLVVYGWAEHIRLIGKLIFIVLRDRTGKAQITLHAKANPSLFESIRSVTPESALVVQGTLKENSKAPRGFEIIPNAFWNVGPAKPGVPLDVTGKISASLSTRLDNRV